MAQVVLGGLGGAIGGGFGRIVGGALGGAIDRSLVASLEPARQRGPRLETLKVQSSAEGAPMACVFGRARVTGQVIWAARFLERRNESRGGKGGPRTVDYDYSLSFAVAICEGPIDGVGRVWADGQPLNLSGVTMRVHRGTEDQTPDPLIEAVEGAAPAYRGTAYAVFEDLPLGPFGNRPPQLAFEVFRRPQGDGLEERLEGVCLIPGAGEFILATETVLRREGLTRTRAENGHNGEGRPDLEVSLDQLQAQCPNLKRVSLVIGWFGNDLRAGHCAVRPGVERRGKSTEPQVWSVAGLDRSEAHLVSQIDGHPAYGGTPSDESVRQAVAAVKARGWKATLYPFVFMDIPADNDLPDPYGGARQAAHPWRGRIKGADGAGATAEIAALFGGATDWGLRRLALHYAGLAAETDADGLLIGSEMRGVTWTRDAAGGHPAVAQYRALAGECRAIMGSDAELSYAADWSEYFGFRPPSGDVVFHLDPLWADAAISHVGIDWYPPLGDWRAGNGGVDADTWKGPDDPDYLAAQVAGGEGFDWFYADAGDRADQVRTPIVDSGYGEDWVFRPKDLVGWWSHAHYDRIGGVRSATATAWVAGMKPIRLTEFGCAAVDRGGNAPNLFLDPKSAESALPPFSSGARDDGMQRRALEAVLEHFGRPADNPVSPVYGGPMLDGADAWCWDARPYPAFPARAEDWADAGAWRTGHWLNGRVSGGGADTLAAILRRGGLEDVDFSIAPVGDSTQGYVIDRPMRTRDALEPLLTAFAMTAAERDGKVVLVGRAAPATAVNLDALALSDEGTAMIRIREMEAAPSISRVRFIDESADYQTGSVTVRSDEGGAGGVVDLILPAVCGAGLAARMARQALNGEQAEKLILAPGPLEILGLEAGDVVRLEGEEGDWRVESVTLDENPSMTLGRPPRVETPDAIESWRIADAPEAFGAPMLAILDLPPLPGGEGDPRPLLAVAADPWRPMQVVAGPGPEGLTARGEASLPTRVGVLIEPLAPGVVGRWDETNAIFVRVEGGAPASLGETPVLGGANAVAVEAGDGWEIAQFRSAELVGQGVWKLTGLLRAQQGTDAEMAAGSEAGRLVVFLDDAVGRASLSLTEVGLPLIWRAGPAGGAPGGSGVSERAMTLRGLFHRPWSPAHLRVTPGATGFDIGWIARSRLNGDVWDRDLGADPMRFRVRVLDGDVVIRRWETSDASTIYETIAVGADFPGGPGPDVRIAVAQAGEVFGWGVEAVAALPV
ncbi:baseplate multidomain protein megatron [Brevundimonas goettingensis]|uniref:Glycoside hydrolase/phage tail family protein n=1 Tax=Brevundimonas goettingensis TaxID=2774190 RepID=A0A975C496_9CAUL|nr:glycoside hydrolase/phage tail family protein [Brevundimonas goettingensis]QTC91605.1 glycoside hydrolase/phage tail family protein [Brevundimonas goettingensis]